MPHRDVLEAAAKTNPHGFGFVTDTECYKSLDFGKFMQRLSKVDDSQPCIMHFRLATHGSVKTSNCHPFRHGNVFMAHNGILNVQPEGDKTDSQTAFDRYIWPAIHKHGFGSEEVRFITEALIGSYSKIAMMQRGRILAFGDFIEREGCLYSNLRFEYRLKNSPAIATHGAWRAGYTF